MQEITSLSQALKHSSLKELSQEVMVQVREYPQDLKARTILFTLYCVEGYWDKALQQLQTMELLEDPQQKQTELYKNLVFSEIQRIEVLTGKRQAATLLGEMPDWMAKIHQANVQHYQGNDKLAECSRSAAFELAPEHAGYSENLGNFHWIADSDSRLGPVCEFICAGGYRWIPFSSLENLNLCKPTQLLDLLWLPAMLTSAGERYHGYIPARYPVGEADEQNSKLGLKTEWLTLSASLICGSGRKVLATDMSEHSIMEAGDIVFEPRS